MQFLPLCWPCDWIYPFPPHLFLSQQDLKLVASDTAQPYGHVIEDSRRMEFIGAQYVDVVVLPEQSLLLGPDIFRPIDRHFQYSLIALTR